MSHMDMVSLSLVLFFLITILVFSCCSRCEARNSISVSDPLIGETLVSAGSKFELGFFTPEGNVEGKRYLGIWYSSKLPPKTVVWVAKRETSLHDSCGVLCIADDGNVQVRCGNGEVIPITSLERSENFNRTLQLFDSGNLVLVDGKSDARLWESFNEPTDTFLPGMNMNDGLEFTSWISQGDPGKGNFTFRQTEGVYVIHKRLAVHWQSDEPGMFVKQNALPNFVDQMLSDSNGVMDQKSLQPVVVGKTIPVTPKANCSMYKNCGYFNYNNSRLMMNSSGEIQFFTLVHGGSWDLLWSAPKDYCSVYKQCGYFGICSEKDDQPRCRCPPGYKIASLEDWDAGKYSGGCERVSATCNPNNQTFSNLLLTSVGGQITPYDQAEEEEDCRTECLNDCNCVAYSFRNITVREAQTSDPNCFTWAASDLVFHGDGTSGGLNLSLRVPLSPTGADEVNPKKDSPKNDPQRRYVIVIVGLVAGIILLSCSGCILYRRRRMAERPETLKLAQCFSQMRVKDTRIT